MGEILISKEGEALPPTPAEQALTPQPVIGLGEQPATVTVPVPAASTPKLVEDRESYQEIQEALAVMGELLEQDVEEEEEELPQGDEHRPVSKPSPAPRGICDFMGSVSS